LQKLYPGGYVLGKLGIDIVGRGTILRRNYRNTQQILRAAYAMVENTRFSDLDENDTVVDPPEYSPREGALPVVKGFSYPEEEVPWVKQEIERLTRQQGLNQGDFAILYRSRYPYKDLITAQLDGQAIEITRDYTTFFAPAVKHTTFDSAKGLEFKVVFMVGVTDGILVPKDDWSLDGIALEEYLARERSRLFVAMTRARDLLYITYSRGQLSRFLDGISDKYFAR
jgi:superfamily I DNA/RNA helicase